MTESNQNKTEVSTNEIMDFLVEHMVIKEELKDLEEKLKQEMNKQKLDILDAVDDKLAHLKGDLVVLMRKEDRKVITLVEILKEKKILTLDEAKIVLAMEPFPQLAV